MLHILIIPALTLIFSILIQDKFSQNDFFNYYKIYLFGIIGGIVYILLSSIIEIPFAGSAYLFSVLIKSIIRGILLTALITLGLFILIEFFSERNIYSSWSVASIFSFSYITGLYTIINIREIIIYEYPNYPISYLAFIPFILSMSLIAGFALYIIVDSYNLIIKILWTFLFFVILVLVDAAYNFLYFYNYIYIYSFLLLFIVIAALFEFIDFKNFR